MPRLKKETRQARVDRILAAAERCFVRQGFEATTIADVCEEAGVSVGALYSHFDGKEALVEAICEPAMAERRALLASLSENDATLADAEPMLDLVRALLSTPQGTSDAKLDVHLWAESIRNRRVRALTRRAFRALDDGLTALVENGQAQGALRPDLDARAIAALLVSAVAGLEVRRAVGLDHEPEAIVMALKALGGDGWGRGGPSGDTA